MAKPIEIRVGAKLIWKDGAPGPAYAELQCYAREYGPDEGRVSTYAGSAAPVPGPACEVVSGAPFVDYSLSLHHPVDDAMGLWIDSDIGFEYVDGVDSTAVPQDASYFGAAVALDTAGVYRKTTTTAPVTLPKDAWLIITTAGAANAKAARADVVLSLASEGVA